MKISTLLKILGFLVLAGGVTLIVLACTYFSEYDTVFESTYPNFFMLAGGVFASFAGIAILITGFRPSIAKASAKLHSETMDKAGQDIGVAASKTATTVSPAVTTVVGAVREGMYPQNGNPQAGPYAGYGPNNPQGSPQSPYQQGKYRQMPPQNMPPQQMRPQNGAQQVQRQVFCKHCGKPIDSDSKFCMHCAGKQ